MPLSTDLAGYVTLEATVSSLTSCISDYSGYDSEDDATSGTSFTPPANGAKKSATSFVTTHHCGTKSAADLVSSDPVDCEATVSKDSHTSCISDDSGHAADREDAATSGTAASSTSPENGIKVLAAPFAFVGSITDDELSAAPAGNLSLCSGHVYHAASDSEPPITFPDFGSNGTTGDLVSNDAADPELSAAPAGNLSFYSGRMNHAASDSEASTSTADIVGIEADRRLSGTNLSSISVNVNTATSGSEATDSDYGI